MVAHVYVWQGYATVGFVDYLHEGITRYFGNVDQGLLGSWSSVDREQVAPIRYLTLHFKKWVYLFDFNIDLCFIGGDIGMLSVNTMRAMLGATMFLLVTMVMLTSIG